MFYLCAARLELQPGLLRSAKHIGLNAQPLQILIGDLISVRGALRLRRPQSLLSPPVLPDGVLHDCAHTLQHDRVFDDWIQRLAQLLLRAPEMSLGLLPVLYIGEFQESRQLRSWLVIGVQRVNVGLVELLFGLRP